MGRVGRLLIALPAALVFSCPGAHAGTARPDDVAQRFRTAPDTASAQQQLVRIEANGVDFGTQLIRVSNGEVTLPPGTLGTLGIVAGRDQALLLSPSSGITARLNETEATLSLQVPVSMLAAQRFAPDADDSTIRLSPETWGAYADYDLNLRHEFGRGTGANSSSVSAGGFVELRALAPDAVGSSSWAFDSSRLGPDALIRLDSTLTWRPAALNLAVSGGDVVSSSMGVLSATRPYRFAGFQIGNDYSGTPGWSSTPFATVNGTAEAQSAIDLYLEGQRTFHTDTAGGPFSLVLPPGATGTGTKLVLTDVSGRSVVLAIDVPRSDVQLLRQGMLLWSAGAGSPRFGYGSSRTVYDGQPYAYGSARYGAWDRVTATAHAEGGAGLVEAEAGADVAVASWLGAHGSMAASRSGRGVGSSARGAILLSGPWRLSFEATLAHTFGPFDDVVSVSGRAYGRRHGLDPIFSLPARSAMSGRLSWQPTNQFSLSTSYQSNSYKGSRDVGFASISANYLLANRIPTFVNLSHAMGGQRTTAVVVGVSFSLGAVQSSVSGGYGTGSGPRSADRGGYTAGVTASQPLGETVGDLGWNVYATRAPTGNFATADARIRTGYGVPGVEVQTIGNQTTGYVTLRGSAGVVGLHPFVSDPAYGGIIIADAGRSGVPVQLNGFDKGRTSLDGKIAIAGAVPGTSQHVAIDTAGLPLDTVPTETDQLVVVRDRGGAVVSFGVQSASASAMLAITWHGQPPPAGSIVLAAGSSAPISKEGRAYLASLDENEVLTVEMPDGRRCEVRTKFDGRGGVGRKLGTFACAELH